MDNQDKQNKTEQQTMASSSVATPSPSDKRTRKLSSRLMDSKIVDFNMKHMLGLQDSQNDSQPLFTPTSAQVDASQGDAFNGHSSDDEDETMDSPKPRKAKTPRRNTTTVRRTSIKASTIPSASTSTAARVQVQQDRSRQARDNILTANRAQPQQQTDTLFNANAFFGNQQQQRDAQLQFNGNMTEEEALRMLTGQTESQQEMDDFQEKALEAPQHFSLESLRNQENSLLIDKVLSGCYYTKGLLNSTNVPSIQIVFVWDTTGSMFQAIQTVRQKLYTLCSQLLSDLPDIQIAMIAFGDYNDANVFYTMHKLDFSNDLDHMGHFVKRLKGTGGDDPEECYEFALRECLQLNWNPQCQNKCVVMIGDDLPHSSQEYLHLDWQTELKNLTDNHITIHAIQCLQRNYATDFYKNMAQLGNGHYLELDNFDSMLEIFLGITYRSAGDHQMQHLESMIASNQTNSVVIKRPEESNEVPDDSQVKEYAQQLESSSSSNVTFTDEEMLQIHEAIHSATAKDVTIQGQKYDISQGKAGCKFVSIQQTTFIEQNAEKQSSKYAKMVSNGQHITWIIQRGNWGIIMK